MIDIAKLAHSLHISWFNLGCLLDKDMSTLNQDIVHVLEDDGPKCGKIAPIYSYVSNIEPNYRQICQYITKLTISMPS